MLRHPLLPVFIISIILAFSCKEDDCTMNKLGSCTFSEAELNIVPYRLPDSVTFTNLSGKRISFSLTDRRSDYSLDNNKRYEKSTSEYPDCPGNYYDTEANYTSFIGTGNNKIFIQLCMTNPFQPNFRNLFSIYVAFTDSIVWFHNSTFTLDSLGLSQDPYYHGILASKNDSLEVGPTVYYNVYELVYPDQPSPLGYLKTLYYNSTVGILGFKTNSGQLWWLDSR